MKRLFLLSDPLSPRLNPSLAVEIGLEESILLLQLEYWMQGKNSYTVSMRQIRATFPFWAIGTIHRKMQSLQDQGLITREPEGRGSATYSLNLETVGALSSVHVGDVGVPEMNASVPEMNTPHSVGGVPEMNTIRKTKISSKNTLPLGKVVLGQHFDAFINTVVSTYPANGLGIRATVEAATTWAKKQKSMDEAKSAMVAVRNYAAAVESGEVERKYVMGFAKFAGLGLMYHQDPKWREWVARETPEKKTRLIY